MSKDVLDPEAEARDMRTKTRPGRVPALVLPADGPPAEATVTVREFLEQFPDQMQGDTTEVTASQQDETPRDEGQLLINRVHDLEVLKAAQDAHITFLHDQLDQLIDIVEGLSRQVTGKPQRPVVRTPAERRS